MTLSLRCYHCNEPVPAKGLWSAWVLGEDRPMCCAGCQAVAQAIVTSGGESYYAQRTSTALEPKQLERLSVWADLLEDPAWTGRHIQTVTSRIQIPGQAQSNQDTDQRETTLAIEGLRCGACAWLIESVLSQTPGVVHARANASTARLRLRWNPRLTGLNALSQSLLRLGYAAVPLGASQLEEQRRRQEKLENRRLFVAVLGWAQVRDRPEARAPSSVGGAAEHLNEDVRDAVDLGLDGRCGEEEDGSTRAGRLMFSPRSSFRQQEEVSAAAPICEPGEGVRVRSRYT